MSISTDTKYLRLISSRLRNFKQKKEGLFNFSCPICGDSKKNLTKARGYAFSKGNDYFYRCHNCGVSTTLGNLLKDVDPSLHKEYVLENYKTGQSNNHQKANSILQITSPKFGKVDKQKVFEHAEWCDRLPEEHFCIAYLKARQIPKECYKMLLFTNKYKQFVTALVPGQDKVVIDDARLVIPFYNKYNDLIAVSGRALETSDKTLRYITMRTNDDENKLVYGMERVKITEKIFLVEGPIDSLFLNNCIASGDANLALTAKDISSGDKVLIFDNEPRNKEVVKLIQNAIKLGYDVVIWPSNIKGKDINEMVLNGKSPSEIQGIISSNTFKGIQAQLKFNMWKKV
jgi:transcription elongation factor Elf1